jgi:arylsulfatase A-like enzyme/tetratricopeptide (TPR) repeat protein
VRSSWWIPLPLLLSACAGEQPTTPAAPAPLEATAQADGALKANLPNVVLITLDTTRADRLGAYGYDNAATQNMDKLAAKGRVYEYAYSPLPLTIPSHAAIFTGLYPPTIGIRNNGTAKLEESAYTLTEHLRNYGYATVGSISAFVTSSEWGFNQGFEKFYDDLPKPKAGDFWHNERPGEHVVDDLLDWAARSEREGPVFAWAHFYDPHFPYKPSQAYAKEIKGKPYDGEIAYVDDQIGRLFEVFDPKETLYVIVGDHGESLGKHGELTHGIYVYDDTQRVPFIVSGPGVSSEKVTEGVSIVDVSPTILSILGLPEMGTMDGKVVPVGELERPLYMESYQLSQRFGFASHVGIVSGSYKLIDLPDAELYDVRADPGELNNLAESKPEEVERLKKLLKGLEYGVPSTDPAHPVDPTVALQLEALGYVEAGFKGDLSGDLPDPKLHTEAIRLSQLAERHLRHKQEDEALAILKDLSEQYPEAIEFKTRQAMLLIGERRFEEANVIVEKALEQDPENAMLKYSLAVNRARRGKHKEASALFQELARSMPFSPRVRTMAVAAMYSTEGGENEAMNLAFTYLEQYPKDRSLAGWLGVKLALAGELNDATKLLEMGILADRPERDVAFLLAGTMNARGDRGRARELLEQEVREYPNNQKAVSTLIAHLGADKDWQGLVTATEIPAERGLLDAWSWHARAQAMFNLGLYKQARPALNKGLEKDPDLAILLLLDANLLSKEGKKDAAKIRFEKAKAAKAKE